MRGIMGVCAGLACALAVATAAVPSANAAVFFGAGADGVDAQAALDAFNASDTPTKGQPNINLQITSTTPSALLVGFLGATGDDVQGANNKPGTFIKNNTGWTPPAGLTLTKVDDPNVDPNGEVAGTVSLTTAASLIILKFDNVWAALLFSKPITQLAFTGLGFALSHYQSGSALIPTPFSVVPLPPALLLFGTALVGLGVLGRRRRKLQQAAA